MPAPPAKAGRSALGAAAPERISPEDFSRISRLARERLGIELRAGKEELVSARIARQARHAGSAGFHDYVRNVMSDSSGEALLELLDALTTNHTAFLREPAHFDFLVRTVLDECAAARPLRVWCAACSSGEEAYTIAFLLSDWSRATGKRFELVASDVSARVLACAQRAVYPAARCAALGSDWLHRYFLEGVGRWAGHYRVRPEIVKRIGFRQVNLIQPLPPMQFDVIFCRNVMIYFSPETQAGVVERLAARLEPGGYLFTGHAESLTGLRHSLQFIRPAVYRLPRDPAGTRGRFAAAEAKR